MSGNRTLESERLLTVLSRWRQVLVVMHDNPDPDAIATGWAVQWLVTSRLPAEVRMVAGGEIVRAENQQMCRLLKPPLELVQTLDAPPSSAVVLVDCGFGTMNHLLSVSRLQPVAVIDHHEALEEAGHPIPFYDVRPQAAAAVSIAASYLREQRLEVSIDLATAMLYALHTETRGSEAHYSRLDRTAFAWLSRRADPSKLAEIESAPLSRAYFADLALALQNTFLYDDAALCLLPRAQGPETIAEVADLLIRCHGVRRVLCGAVLGNTLLLSARTVQGSGNAARLVQVTLEGIGHGGGHEHRAGGKLVLDGRLARPGAELYEELRNRWLAACNVERRRGTRLVARREIVGNL